MIECKDINKCEYWYCNEYNKCLFLTLDHKTLKKLKVTKSGKKRSNRRITPSKRRQVYSKNDYRCVYCGATTGLTIDHIIPISKGGTNAHTNLQTMCFNCNGRKGDKIENKKDV